MDMDGLLPSWAAAKMDRLEAELAGALDQCKWLEADNARLRAALEEIAQLRAALQRIVDNADNKNWRKPELIREARRALEGK